MTVLFASDERLTFTDMRRYGGSVMELKKKAEQHIIGAMDWGVEFGNLMRKEIPENLLDAIREAITNSFGHKLCKALYNLWSHERGVDKSFQMPRQYLYKKSCMLNLWYVLNLIELLY